MVYAAAKLLKSRELVAPCTWSGVGAEAPGNLMDVSGAADPMGLGPVQAGFLPREAGDGRSRGGRARSEQRGRPRPGTITVVEGVKVET